MSATTTTRAVACALVAAIVMAACSGGDDTSPSGDSPTATSAPDAAGPAADPTSDPTSDPTADPTSDPTSDGAASLVLAPTPLVFRSTDGSAFAGSRAVFTVTNAETQESFTFPVDGAGTATSASINVPAGTYRIESTARYVSPTASYIVDDITPAEITLSPDVAAESPTVEFTLEVESSPFDLWVEDVGTGRVELRWSALGDHEIAGYELRRTDGTDAASDRSDGVAVDLESPVATAAVVEGLEPGTDHTFTLFATDAAGDELEFRSIGVTTATGDGSAPAYTLAPNTIVPTDFEALAPEPVSPSIVRVTLDPATTRRGSATALPGVPGEDLESGCVVGMPILVSTEVAGDQAFYGLIESCGGVEATGFAAPLRLTSSPSAPSAPSASSANEAFVNTDVPLAAVVPYLHLDDTQHHRCIDDTGTELGPDAARCAGTDGDGDGMNDTTERALGLDPAVATDGGWDVWLAPEPATPAEPGQIVAPPYYDLETPTDLTTGRVQVTLVWSTGDDLDLFVVDPAGNEVSYRTPSSPTGGQLDRDDLGDETCRSTETRAENIVWPTDAPIGAYSVRVGSIQVESGARSPCSPGMQARLEVHIDGALVSSGPVRPFDGAPTSFVIAGQDDLEITMSWQTGDDLFLLGLEWAQGWTGTFVDTLGRGDCGTPASRSKRATLAAADVRPGTYRMRIENPWIDFNGPPDVILEPCAEPLGARIQIRNGDDVLFDEQLVVSSGGVRGNSVSWPLTVTVLEPRPPAGLRRPTSDPDAAPAVRAAPRVIAAPSVECTSGGAVVASGFDVPIGFDAFHDIELTLKGSRLNWDIEAGVVVYLEPAIKMVGGVECEVDLPGATFQLLTTPVPVNLELKPVIDGSATGTFELTGPKFELTFGVETDGHIDARLETCGWLGLIPCLDLQSSASAAPIGDFTVGEATMKVAGELALGVGMEATLGVGVKNTFVTAKTGFALKMKPLVGKLAASASLDVAPPTAAPSTTEAPAPAAQDATRPAWVERPANAADDYSDWVADPTTLDCPSGGPYTASANVVVDGAAVVRHHCPNAVCYRDLGTRIERIWTPNQTCPEAECYAPGDGSAATGQHIVLRELSPGQYAAGDGYRPVNPSVVDGPISCPTYERAQIPVEQPDEGGTTGDTGPPVANPLQFCAQASVGGELSVDFRAETFVLAWGKDKRFPVWEGEYAYPGASFDLGDCDD